MGSAIDFVIVLLFVSISLSVVDAKTIASSDPAFVLALKGHALLEYAKLKLASNLLMNWLFDLIN